MTLTVTCDGPLDVGKTLARYHRWGVDPANRMGPGVFRRVARVGDLRYGYEVRWSGEPHTTRLEVSIPGVEVAAAAATVLREVRAIFGLDADLVGFYRLAKGDPVLATLVEPLWGLRPTLTPVPLEMLVGAICAQQVNLAFAFAIRGRLVRRYGLPMEIGGETVYAFPDAEALARAPSRELRRMQFSERKAEYVVGIARGVLSGALDLDGLAGRANEDAIERLTRLRGLGRWTAEWFLARCLGRGDVCPAGDLAVRKAFVHYYSRGRPSSERAILRRARAWGPYQNLAVHYLLAGLRLVTPSGRGT